MWFDHAVIDLLKEVTAIPHDLRNFRASTRDVGYMTTMLRGIRVQSTHRKPYVEFQVGGISTANSHSVG